MSGQGSRAAAALAAISVALLLGACGGDSDSEPTVDANEAPPSSGARPNALNNVNEQLRGDILSFGEKGSEAELAKAAVVVRGYLDARVGGDYPKACSYLSEYMLSVAKGMARQRGEEGCVAGMENLEAVSSVDEIEGPVKIEPDSIRRNGVRTFVIYEDGYGDTYAMLMRHEKGTWKIQGFEPTRLS